MISTHKKRLSNKKPFSHSDDFDRDLSFANTVSDRQENVVVIGGTVDQKFTASDTKKILRTNENLLHPIILERCSNERIDKQRNNVVDTVGEKIENAYLIAFNSEITPKNELAVTSIFGSSLRGATSVITISERGKGIEITAPFENLSESKYKL